ncbi:MULTISPECIES: hypothetical protein [Anaerotignum]|uniref:Uncharacterized protein n=1 Tax=Anaerotignum propionicum DSM 1682 TaxID=991789 RepID=A0A110A719_ANAPI|nr:MULTISPECIES: hypothetical protein [Anaerotignum]AMJ40376.1 hypothetical protein CPRO_07750 [Anaerotignum propionicum DSM 1682]MEA5057255.1 hypothetical protein [Anaerotignum propionicum]SHE43760.1 hypothetical protein SAMN02745151_00705 [[Clostridium] propionicum DSM 1682] [Anaerotignum propionicum DSM 1682]
MAYASYEYYTQEFFGRLIPSIEEFDRLAERASEYLDSITMRNAKSFRDSGNELKRACCAIAEIIVSEESCQGKNSESVGAWSVSYTSKKDLNIQKYNIAKQYLLHTGLLYQGMR